MPASPDAILHPRDSALGRAVEKSWLLSRRVCDADGRFAVLPDAHFGVGVVLQANLCRILVGGPVTRAFRAHPGSGIYWLRFRPGVLPRLADVRPAELVGEPGILVDRVRGVDLDELGERLAGTPSTRGRLDIIGASLGPILEAPWAQDRRCVRVLELVDALDGRISVRDLAQETGLGTRTLQRLLMAQVGLSPKRLLQNVRLQRTAERLRAHAAPPAEIALESGYADQSHMIRDFRRLAGRLPSTF